MKKGGGYDGNKATYLKNETLLEVLDIFASIEIGNAVLERIECNADTFKFFRNLGSQLVEQPLLRDCRRGLVGRIWTAEIWMNNALKDGQLKLYFNNMEIPSESPKAKESLDSAS